MRWVIVVVGVAVCWPVGVYGVDATVNPVADAFLFGGEAGLNYGGAGQLAVSDAGQPEGEFQTLIRFDLAGAKAQFDAALGAGLWRVESAALRLSTSNPNNPLFNANVAGAFGVSWMENDSWLEGTGGPMSPTTNGATFSSLPSLVSAGDERVGTFGFAGGNSGTSTYALEVGPGLAGDVEAGGLLSLRLFAEAGGAVSYNFSSRSFQTVGNRPVLTVSAVAVPEPGVVGGMVLGALVVGGGRGRRKT